jgi:hypothetical protein
LFNFSLEPKFFGLIVNSSASGLKSGGQTSCKQWGGAGGRGFRGPDEVGEAEVNQDEVKRQAEI